MALATETKDAKQFSLPQSAWALLRRYLSNRKALVVLAVAVVGAGLALNWSWLVAAGVAPILLALAPCAAMCAVGLCMNKMGSKSCSGAQDDAKKGGQ